MLAASVNKAPGLDGISVKPFIRAQMEAEKPFSTAILLTGYLRLDKTKSRVTLIRSAENSLRLMTLF